MLNARLVARFLEGSWRAECPPLSLTPHEIARVAPLLIGSGAAALGWRRVKDTPALKDCAEAQQLCQSGRILALEDSRNDRAVKHIAALLNEQGIEPLIFKGWAVARYYARSFLRPYGDIDLGAPSYFIGHMRSVLRRHAVARLLNPDKDDYFVDCGPSAKICCIDLHSSLKRIGMEDIDTLYARAGRVRIGDAHLRVLAPEDHLRFVIVHLLRHGGWRPLWLCDVAAMIENLDAGFNWDQCLTDDKRVARWIGSTIMLAHRLLGCRVEGIAPSALPADIPNWLERTMLGEWEAPFASRYMNLPADKLPTRASDILPWVEARWPNPIRATVGVGGAFNSAPRLPYQIAHFANGAIKGMVRLLGADRWTNSVNAQAV